MFDPQQFLQSTFTEANDTVFEPIPAGEYFATIAEIKPNAGTSKDGNPWTRIDITWSLTDPALAERLGRTKLTVRQGIMLDITDSGGLDMGKGRNIALGRLRDALGLNVPGEPFSFLMLTGRSAKVNVTQRIYEGKVFNDIKDVARA